MTEHACKRDGCDEPRARNSKYCKTHKALARDAWRDTVRDSVEKARARYDEFQALYSRACAEGALGVAKAPPPRGVEIVRVDLADKPIAGEPTYYLDDFPCGFAWVNIRPGNSPFANWLKKHGYASKAYEGGVTIWISAYGQSMRKKEAYANAFAEFLRTQGITAYAHSRMD